MSFKTKLLYSLIYVLFVSLLIRIQYGVYRNSLKLDHELKIAKIETSYAQSIYAQRLTSKIIFHRLMRNPQVIKLLKDANSTDITIKNNSRTQLHEILHDDFERLKARGLNLLHFHLPNNESFLRFHRPNRYGDNLTGVRYSVEKANKMLVEVHGYEEGRIFNAYRNVYPIVVEGEHLGSVEISMPLKSISEETNHVLDTNIDFLLKKESLETKPFTSELNNSKINASDDYLLENTSEMEKDLERVNHFVDKKAIAEMAFEKPFVQYKKLNSIFFDVVYYPIKDTQNNVVLFLVSYDQNSVGSKYYTLFKMRAIGFSIILLIIILLIFQLTQKNSLLKHSIKEKQSYYNLIKEQQSIFSEGPVVIFKWQNMPGWPIEQVTGNVYELSGYTAEEFEAGDVAYTGLIYHDDVAQVGKEVYEAGIHSKEHIEHAPYRIFHKNGSIVWLLNYTTILRDRDGNITHYYGYVIDISPLKVAEEKARVNGERLKLALEGTQAGIWDWYIQTGDVSFDEQWANIAGYALDDFKQLSIKIWNDFLHPDDLKKLDDYLPNYLKDDHKYFEFESRIKHKNGNWIWVLDRGKVVEWSHEKKPLRMTGTRVDITKRKVAEKNARKNDERLKLALKGTQAGIWDWYVRSNKVDFNERWANILGYSLEELKNISTDSEGWKNSIHPDDRDESELRLQAHFNNKTDYFKVERRVKHRNGNWIWVLDRGQVVKWDSNNEPVRMTGTRVDITKRKMAEINLRQSQEQYKGILEAMSDMVFVMDKNHVIISVDANQEGMHIDPKMFIGKKQTEIMPPNVYQPFEDAIEYVMSGNVEDYECSLKLEDGLNWFSVKLSPIFDKDEYRGSVAVVRNVTIQKEYEAKIESSLKEKVVLLKEIHHRVKNNLQVIISMLEMQSDKINSDEAKKAFSESNSRIRAMSLIHEVLYRSDNLGKVDLKEYITGLIQTITMAIQKTTTKIEHSLNIENLDLTIDQTIPLALIINELLTNVYKYAFSNRSEGIVNIEIVLLEENKVQLHFYDNGVGFPDNYDVEASESLGMTIVSILAEGQLFGTLERYNDNGSHFKIKFDKQQTGWKR